MKRLSRTSGKIVVRWFDQSESVARSPETDGDVLRSDPHHLCDLGMRQAFEGQGQHLSMTEGQRPHVPEKSLRALLRSMRRIFSRTISGASSEISESWD